MRLLYPLTIAFLCAPVLAIAAGSQNAAEYEIKAAFLYKLASFIDWPPDSPSGPLCIGVIGHDPFGDALEQAVRGQTVRDREFVVRRYKPGDNFATCHILFISPSERTPLHTILERVRTCAILTVSDQPGFCEKGGTIELDFEDGRVRFQINPEAADRAHLQLSSKLLALGTIVHATDYGSQ